MKPFRIAAIAFAGAVISSPSIAASINLEATCGDETECEVVLEGNQIKTSLGTKINTDNIIGYTLTNSSNVGGLILKSRNEDYRFLIKYFDSEGNRQLSQIGFYNFKSAQNFLSMLTISSGLSPDRDLASASSTCKYIGRDVNSATEFNGGGPTSAVSNIVNQAAGAASLGAYSKAFGDILGPSAFANGVGTIGAIAGSQISGSSGNMNLKRSLVSDIRSVPASSSKFYDSSFANTVKCE